MPDFASITTHDLDATYPEPEMFRITQDGDELEVRGYYGVYPWDDHAPAATFVCNSTPTLEVHLHGELYLMAPAIRHDGTLSLHNVNAAEPIVKFCTGASTEVLRVEEDGTLTVPERTAHASVHATAFCRNVLGASYASAGIIVSGADYFSASLGTSATGSAQQFLAAFPTGVPQGATVTSIQLLYKVAYNGVHPFSFVDVTFFKSELASGAGSVIQLVQSQTGTGSFATWDESLSETIDYTTYSYGFWVGLKNAMAGASRCYGLRITYTYTTLGG